MIAVRLLSWFNRIVGLIAEWILLVLGAYIVLDVFLRFFFNKPLVGTAEVVTMVIVAVFFLSFAYCEEQGRHIRLTFVSARLSPKVQEKLDIVVWALGFVVMAGFAWQAWLGAMVSLSHLQVLPTMANVPVYPTKFMIALGTALLALQFLANIAKRLWRVQ